MKKYIILLGIAASICACTQTIEDKGEDIDTSGYTVFDVDTEELNLSGAAFSDTWDNGDFIGVFGSENGENVPYSLSRSSEGLSAATFYGELVKGNVMAYFPYTEGVTRQNGMLPCELERNQAFVPDASKTEFFLGLNPRTFASLGEDGTLHFRYPMGMMSLSIEFEDPVNITAITLNSTLGISGRLDVDATGAAKASPLSHKFITIDLGGQAVSSRSGDSFTEFLLVLPPTTYMAGELSFSIVTTEEEMTVNLGETTVRRVENGMLPITSVVVGSSDIPGYEKQNGYME